MRMTKLIVMMLVSSVRALRIRLFPSQTDITDIDNIRQDISEPCAEPVIIVIRK